MRTGTGATPEIGFWIDGQGVFFGVEDLYGILVK
jgi:hypothetical protein